MSWLSRSGGDLPETQDKAGLINRALGASGALDIYNDADQALEEAASVLQRFTDEALQRTLSRTGSQSHSTATSLSAASGGLITSLLRTEQVQAVESPGRSTDASWGLLGQLTELLQDAEEAAADTGAGLGPNILSPEALEDLARCSSSPLSARSASPEAPGAQQSQASPLAPPSPPLGHLWRLGEAAAADIWTSSQSGSDAHSAASLDMEQPAEECGPDLPACERSQSPLFFPAVQRSPASPMPEAASPQCVRCEEQTVPSPAELSPRLDALADMDMLSRWTEPIEVPSLSPPSPLLPRMEPSQPIPQQSSLGEQPAGEDEEATVTQPSHPDASVERSTGHHADTKAAATPDRVPDIVNEWICSTNSSIAEPLDADSHLGAEQQTEGSLSEEACSTSESDNPSSLAEPLEQYQLASGPVVKGAKVSVGLPEGLATMQDIAEGLQLSQQFNTTSQMLMREIIAMRDTLAVFNSGSAPDATRLPPGEQQKQRSAEEPEALQDLSSFLNGLRAKYGLAESKPLLLSAAAASVSLAIHADASCIVKQALNELSVEPKEAVKQSLQLSGNAVQASLLAEQSVHGLQHDAPAEADVRALTDTGASSPIEQQPLTAALAHTAAQPSRLAEGASADDATDVSENPADNGLPHPPSGAPHWRQLSQTLSRNGFLPIPTEDVAYGHLPALLSNALAVVLREYERRSKLAEELLAVVEHSRARDKDKYSDLQRLKQEHAAEMRRTETSIRSLRQQVQEQQRAAAQSEAAVQRLENDMLRLSRELAAAEHETRDLRAARGDWADRAAQYEAEQRATQQRVAQAEERVRGAELRAARARQALTQAEHGSRAHEAAAQKLRERLAARVRAEERRLQRDADAHARIKRALNSHKGDPKGGSAAGAVSAAVREVRPLEIVGLYESQQEALQTEVAVLRAETRTLLEQLRDAQNQLAIQASGQPRGLSDNAPRRIATMSKAVSEAQTALAQERASAAEAARSAARRVAEAERRAEALAEESESLRLQLNARPTVKAFGALKRQLESLERQLARSHAGPDSAQPSLGAARARKDREVHRAGLEAVGELAQGELADILQQLCLALGMADAAELPAAVARLQRAVTTLPRLERFVTDVCEVVFRRGGHLTQEAQEDPAAVPRILERWVDAQDSSSEAEQLRDALEHLLLQRPGNGSGTSLGYEGIMAQVADMVEREQGRSQAEETAEAAEGLVHANAEALLRRIVAHFQHLFAVDALEGVLPAMNQVYVAYTEGQNVRRAMADVLGLEATASIASCLQCLTQLMSSQTIALGREGPAETMLDGPGAAPVQKDEERERAKSEEAMMAVATPAFESV